MDNPKSASAQIPLLKSGRILTIGSFGTFWHRGLVNWKAHSWSLLGRRGLNNGHLRIADFRRARGVYVLYNDVNLYYVGLANSQRGIGSRLHDHLGDEHWSGWNRFSWFAFDGPDDDAVLDNDGVIRIVQTYTSIELVAPVLIRDLEALLQAVTKPMGNISSTQFSDADEWLQVATANPKLKTFDDLREKLDADQSLLLMLDTAPLLRATTLLSPFPGRCSVMTFSNNSSPKLSYDASSGFHSSSEVKSPLATHAQANTGFEIPHLAGAPDSVVFARSIPSPDVHVSDVVRPLQRIHRHPEI